MRPYNIKPLDFSANEACKTVSSVIRILPEKDGWNVWVDGCTWCLCPYPTFDAAVEVANEIHRKAVVRFLEPARVSVEPIMEYHKDGQHYLTDKGWAYWRVTYWCACNSEGEPYHYSEDGCYGVRNPTLVITIHP